MIPLIRPWLLGSLLFVGTAGAASPSIARLWNEQILAAIRIDRPNPPVHARNLFHLDIAMYDGWAAYDAVAIGYLHHERATAGNVDSARRETISYAAYRVLRHRFASSIGAETSLPTFDLQMEALGYDKSITTTAGNTPAALGNRIAADILAWGLTDGSNEQGGYQDASYFTSQPSLQVTDTFPLGGSLPRGGIPLDTDPNRWQPLTFAGEAKGQGGISEPSQQRFIGVTWIHTLPFAISNSLSILPGPPSRLGSSSDAAYRTGAVQVLKASSELLSDDFVDMSPGRIGNNSLGADDGRGHPLNPFTGKPYPPNMVRLADFARVMAEFWADGPASETPPGHWHLLANQVADNPLTIKKVAGVGPVVSDLEWDVKTYFTLGAALHDAACLAWTAKRFYEGPRPITMIRLMASLGQSSDPSLPSYHPNGLPLVPNLIELITPETANENGRHAGVGDPGEIAVKAWWYTSAFSGQSNAQGWGKGVNWAPYQSILFVTPAFPGYLSGHSTFSSAAAKVLEKITGSAFFPGGFGRFTASENQYLRTESGPLRTTEIQWATYQDAADLAGRSRRWGGIHVPEDDYKGRQGGASVGANAWGLAQKFFSGEILQLDPNSGGSPSSSVGISITTGVRRLSVPSTIRGLPYTLQSSDDLRSWRSLQALPGSDSGLIFTDSLPVPTRFYRIATAVP